MSSTANNCPKRRYQKHIVINHLTTKKKNIPLSSVSQNCLKVQSFHDMKMNDSLDSPNILNISVRYHNYVKISFDFITFYSILFM